MTWEPCCNNYPLRTGPCFLIETLSLLAASNQAAHSLAARRRRSLASERGAERGRCPPTAEDWPPPVLSWWHASFLQKNSWQNRLRRRVRLADEPTQGCCRIQCMCMHVHAGFMARLPRGSSPAHPGARWPRQTAGKYDCLVQFGSTLLHCASIDDAARTSGLLVNLHLIGILSRYVFSLLVNLELGIYWDVIISGGALRIPAM